MEALLARLDARQKRLLGACLAILLLAAGFSYGVLPQIKSLRSLLESREVMARVGASGDGAAAGIARLNADIEGLRNRLQGDMANLPMRQMEAFILGRLQTISWRNGVDLIGVEPAQGESVEMYREVLFRVELGGDYVDLLTWLDDVGSELGFVVIKEFQLGIAEPDPRNPRLTTKLLLAAYRVSDA